MTALSIQPTYPIFTDIDGQPLENGYIWIGTENLDPQTNPINVYWDEALTISAPQPIRTLAGYPSRNGSPGRLYVNSLYSIRVQNRNGSMVYSAPTPTEEYAGLISPFNGNFVAERFTAGFGPAADYPKAALHINKTATNHAHYGVLDNTYYDFTGSTDPIIGSASYNDNSQTRGTHAVDHHYSFQSYPNVELTGAQLDYLSGLYSIATINGSGTVANRYGAKVENALGTGAITKQYGYYSATLTRGTENWAFFSAGITPSFMGGAQYYGTGIDTINAASVDYNPGTGYLRFIPRANYGIEAVCKIFKLGAVGIEAILNNAADGNFYISARNGYATKLDNARAEGSLILTCYGVTDGIALKSASGSGYSGTDSALYVASNTGTSRSINAAGTVNASGADYAEYENNNGLVISKGSVVGFKADGTLTLTYSEAVRFGVKSTNPSLVGGDTWGNEESIGAEPKRPGADEDELAHSEYATALAEFKKRLEVARQKVDRVAYSGKVPCNVLGAQAGGYIVAVDNNGSIAGEFVADPDFSQYKKAVGRVNKILDDGRCEIAVIVH